MQAKIFYRLILVIAFSVSSLPANAGYPSYPDAPVNTAGVSLFCSGSSCGLQVSHTPNAPGPYSGVMFDYNSTSQVINRLGRTQTIPTASIFMIDMTADAGADLYLVNSGDEFSSNTIGAGQFLNLVQATNSGYSGFNTRYYMPDFRTAYQGQYSTSGTFYLGINSGQNWYYPLPYPTSSDRSIYGWAQFSYDSFGLTLLSSALTYNQAGIFVGSLNTVPVPEAETSAMLLMGLGLLGFMARKRKAL